MHDDGLARDRMRAVLEADDLVVARDVDRLDAADARAGDPDLLALDDEAAVVEDSRGPCRGRRPSPVAAGRAISEADGEHGAGYDERSASWSGGTSVALQSPAARRTGGAPLATERRVDERVGRVGDGLGGAARAAAEVP